MFWSHLKSKLRATVVQFLNYIFNALFADKVKRITWSGVNDMDIKLCKMCAILKSIFMCRVLGSLGSFVLLCCGGFHFFC